MQAAGVLAKENSRKGLPAERRETVVEDTAQFAESLAPAVSPVTGPGAEVMRAQSPEEFQSDLKCAEEFFTSPAVCLWKKLLVGLNRTELFEVTASKKLSSCKSESAAFEDSWAASEDICVVPL